jgi:hypothetical protein
MYKKTTRLSRCLYHIEGGATSENIGKGVNNRLYGTAEMIHNQVRLPPESSDAVSLAGTS